MIDDESGSVPHPAVRAAAVPGGYELVQPIGHGGSSVVWEATQLSTGRPVALKILHSDLAEATAATARRRFRRECRVMASLSAHPGIVTVLDAGLLHERPWLSMELCRRGSFATHLTQQGPLTVAAALDVLEKLATALHAAHQQGVVHCDIKPANIMLTDTGEPALSDFGIARVQHTTNTLAGYSVDHVAPEILDGVDPSPRSDVYSLATTTWELLAGRPPFREDGDVSVGTVLTRVQSRQLGELSAAVPPAVLDLLRQMSAKDPQHRVSTMSAVAEGVRDVRAVLSADRSSTSADDIGTTDRCSARVVPGGRVVGQDPGDVPRRGRTRTAAVIVFVLTLAGISGAALHQLSGAGPEMPATAPARPSQTDPGLLPPLAARDGGSSALSPTPSALAPSPAPPTADTTGADAARGGAAPPAPSVGTDAARDGAAPPTPSVGTGCSATVLDAVVDVTGATPQRPATSGPYGVTSCRSIDVRVTDAPAGRTHLRWCFLAPGTEQVTRCDPWSAMPATRTWKSFAVTVGAGTRFQVQVYSDGPGRVSFQYTL